MQATYPLKRFPFQIVALTGGLLAAAIIGAAGGYAARSVDHQASSTIAAGSLPSMVGENARAEATDGLVATQPSLVGENGQVSQPAPKLREGHRR